MLQDVGGLTGAADEDAALYHIQATAEDTIAAAMTQSQVDHISLRALQLALLFD